MTIPGFSRYTIDEGGTVVDTCTGEIVQRRSNHMYDWVRVIPDNCSHKEQVHVHVLMALAFHGPRPDGCVVHFIDGKRKNLAPDNLKWMARSELSKLYKSADRKPRVNNVCNKESMQLLYDTLRELDEPITMVSLAEMLQLPYSVVRYSMYGLIAADKARATYGGYEIND